MPIVVCSESVLIDSRRCARTLNGVGETVYVHRLPKCLEDAVSVSLDHAVVPATQHTVRASNREFSLSFSGGPRQTHALPIGFATPALVAAQISRLGCGLAAFYNSARKRLEFTSLGGKPFELDFEGPNSAHRLLGLSRGKKHPSTPDGFLTSGVVVASRSSLQTSLLQIAVDELEDLSSPLECVHMRQQKHRYAVFSRPRGSVASSLPIHPPRRFHRLSVRLLDESGEPYDPNGAPFFLVLQFGVRRRVLASCREEERGLDQNLTREARDSSSLR